MISKGNIQKDWAKELEAVLGKPSEVRKSTCTGLHGTVYVVVDCSSSMAEGNKMAQARAGAVGFADEAHLRSISRETSHGRMLVNGLAKSTSCLLNSVQMKKLATTLLTSFVGTVTS